MPVARLPEQVHSALLPVNADAGAAAWLPLVRAAVRRTQKRLLILFSGASFVVNCNADAKVIAVSQSHRPSLRMSCRELALGCSQLLRRHNPTSRPQRLKPLHLAGQAASGPPCEALLRLAATALEACVTEGEPQLDLVPLFPTAGWAALAAGTPLRHHTSAGCTATPRHHDIMTLCMRTT